MILNFSFYISVLEKGWFFIMHSGPTHCTISVGFYYQPFKLTYNSSLVQKRRKKLGNQVI